MHSCRWQAALLYFVDPMTAIVMNDGAAQNYELFQDVLARLNRWR